MHKYMPKHKSKHLDRFRRSNTIPTRKLWGNLIMEHGLVTPPAVDQKYHENSPENSEESPSSGVFNDTKTTSTSSQKSRRSLHKRVISVPITEIEGSRLKSEVNAPPSDSWAWRKYGQKPIKGSPYPRGYYRCSSSKGCPARKQVERNRADPTMVIVTYSCDHNHPWPATRNNNQNHHKISIVSPPEASNPTTTQETTSNTDDQEEDSGSPHLSKQSIPEPEFTCLPVGPSGSFATTTDQFGWFSDLESQTMLESPLLAGDIVCDADMAGIFSIRDEDESLFADLGELPECERVFRRREVINEEEHHRRVCTLAPLC